MQVNVSFRPRRQPETTLGLPNGATVRDVLAAVGQSQDSTLVIRAGVPIPEDEAVHDGDDLTILSAFSGG